jgi:hypothetical protein
MLRYSKRNLDREHEVLLASRKLKQFRPINHYGQKNRIQEGTC